MTTWCRTTASAWPLATLTVTEPMTVQGFHTSIPDLSGLIAQVLTAAWHMGAMMD